MFWVAARSTACAVRRTTRHAMSQSWCLAKPHDQTLVPAFGDTPIRSMTLCRRSITSSTQNAYSHDDAAVARGDPEWHIMTPVISDQVSIPDGVVGDIAEINVKVGDVVEEGHVAVEIETHKACLNVKATGAQRMRVLEILCQVGDETKEGDPLVLVEKAEEK